jgi:hypothetical protein
MDYESFFKQRLDRLHAEGRYRVFANLERRCGFFPRAYDAVAHLNEATDNGDADLQPAKPLVL